MMFRYFDCLFITKKITYQPAARPHPNLIEEGGLSIRGASANRGKERPSRIGAKPQTILLAQASKECKKTAGGTDGGT